MKILNQVANIIQKNWRGYYTRKMLREYFEQLYIDSQNFHEQNMVGLNKSQQYLYQQTSQNQVILEDEREDYSESNTHPSKLKRVEFIYLDPQSEQVKDTRGWRGSHWDEEWEEN